MKPSLKLRKNLKPLKIVNMFRKVIANIAIGIGVTLSIPTPSYSITLFQFDYSYDTNGFFADPNRKARLEEAASYYSSFSDSLSAICTPSCGDSNTWNAQFFEPGGTGTLVSVANLAVNANTLIVYAGGRDLGPATLGLGGPGGFSASGTSSFFDNVLARGQSGASGLAASRTDFSPWGGSVSFTNNASITWNFGDASTAPSIGQYDFLSVALHELGHLMGIISGVPSWNNRISGTSFTGASSVSVYGSSVPLSSDSSHWAGGTMSERPGTNLAQEAAMNPSLTPGTRKFLTKLDYAGFKDVGWEVSDSLTGIPFEFKPDLAIFILGTGLIGRNLWLRRR